MQAGEVAAGRPIHPDRLQEAGRAAAADGRRGLGAPGQGQGRCPEDAGGAGGGGGGLAARDG